MSASPISVRVQTPAWRDALPKASGLIRGAARAALAGESGKLAILLADDETMGDLNGRFRGKPRPTNVLAFPAPANADSHLGDIAMGLGVCAAEAATQGKSLADHVSHLAVHGVLHLRGFDHDTPARASEMEALERRLLAGLGVADPYREQSHARPAA